MSPRLPSMTALRVLEAFDRLGSTTAAGVALGLTQSAVSRQLKTLESHLDAPLFSREGRNLVLTPAGQDYADKMREVLGRVAQAGMRLHAPASGGQLTLAILPTFGMRWLVPRLPSFAEAHPDVTLNLVTRLKPFNFALESIDAAIHFGEPEWPNTEVLRLKSETVLPVASPSLVASPIGGASDIAALPLLHIATRPDAWATWFARHGEGDARITGTVHDQYSTIMQAALHGLGAALLPTYLAQPEISAGRLVSLWGAPIEMPGAYYLVWPRSKARDRALSAFRDWLRTQRDDEDMLPR